MRLLGCLTSIKNLGALVYLQETVIIDLVNQNRYIPLRQITSRMIDKKKLAEIADLLKDYLIPVDPEVYEVGTGISREDFREIDLVNFDGNIFAVDGSNVVIFDLGSVNLNFIRAGYSVYHGTKWQKTVITYNNIFLADEKNYSKQFNRYLERFFELEIGKSRELSGKELDRISTFFRDLQEYVAIFDAIKNTNDGDIILYDGSLSDWRDPYYSDIFNLIFKQANDKNVDLLGISKSSKYSWGQGISIPLVRSTDYIGSQIMQNRPWYVKYKSWDQGETYIAKFNSRSTHAFRVDAPTHVTNHIQKTMGQISMYSASAECLGYPHALFRIHHDIKISSHERDLIRLLLDEEFRNAGINEQHICGAKDYHERLDMIGRK